MKFVILSFAILAAATGCQSVRTSWHKKGASAAQVKADRRYCEDKAGGYDFLRPGRRRSQRAGNRSRSELYRWCMRDLGYRRID
ncbi:MAG: hypothetical protein ACTSUD_14860 [Alphaproteobacteria bacterium]